MAESLILTILGVRNWSVPASTPLSPPSPPTTTLVTLSCDTLMTTGNSRSVSVIRISFSMSLSFKVFATKRFCHKSLIACRFCVRVSSSVYRFMLDVYPMTATLDCGFQQVQITTFFVSYMFSRKLKNTKN